VAIERARSETEREAFASLVGEFERLWPDVADAHAPAQTRSH